MSSALHSDTPDQALRAMVDAGAVFSIRHRDDGLGISFTYRVSDEGDLDRCRAILAAVKAKPPAFFQAFRAAVQEAADLSPSEIGEVETTPISAGRGRPEGGAETPPSALEGDVETSPTPSALAPRRDRGAA